MVYLNRFFICTFVVIAIVCAVNWFIDPYGMYWSPVIVGINSTKPASGDRVRVIKAYRAPEFAPQVLIVGNSRAEMALHPEHPSFDSARVYNQAMPGAGIRLQTDYARNTIDTTPSLKRVIMSVDYLDFLVRHARFSEPHIEDAAPDYLLRLPLYTPGWSGRAMRLREKSALLFSLDGLLDSVRTVFQQSAAVNSIDPTGFNDPASYVNILRHEGINALFVQKLEGLDGNMRGRDLMTIDSDTGQRSPQYGILADFLADLSEQDIQKICDSHNMVFLDTKKPLGEWCLGAKYIKINDYEYRRSIDFINSNQEVFSKVIHTKGGEGCIFLGKTYPVKKIEVKDSSGAGDSFMAAFAVKYLLTKDIEKSIRYANECASQVVTKRGVTII